MNFRFFLFKEVKKYPFFFILLFFTLTLGTLGLSGISIISDQVEFKLREHAKELLTSDLVVSARRDLFAAEKESLKRIISRYEHSSYQVIDIYSMVTKLDDNQVRLVEIRSIEEGFPFYGKLVLSEGEFRPDGLYISKDLAEIWNIKPGQELKIGNVVRKVLGIIVLDSSQGLRGFSLAPRIYLSHRDIEESELLKPGATGSFAYHYLFQKSSESEIDLIKNEILKSIPDSAVKVTLPEDSSEQTGRVLNYITDFMGLAALIGLVLSLVGIFYLYQSHLVARLKDLCLLNLHGLTKIKITQGILIQFSVIFFIVFLGEFLIFSPLYNKFAPLLSHYIGLNLSNSINVQPLLIQFPFLYMLSLAILVPLLLGLLRTPMGLQLKASKISMGRFRFFDFFPFMLLLWGYACFLSHSYKIGSIFFGSICGIFIFSTILIKLFQWFIRKLIWRRGLLNPSIESGIALRNFTRSGHKMTLSFLSLAMGATLISLILQLDRMIQKEFTLDESKPALFIFDIQEEQLEDLLKFAKVSGTPLKGVTPMIRARMEKVNGIPFKRSEKSSSIRTREDDVESRFKNRALNLTYRDKLSRGEKIVAGEPFPPDQNKSGRPAWVSLEKRFSQRLGLKLGDQVTFDVQGVEVEGIVKNLREVKWTSFYPNFFVNVEPGFIDEAPKTYLAVLPAGAHDKKRDFQRASVLRFPNISMIDVEEITSKLSALFTKSRIAIEMISWLSLGVGLVILYGLSHDQVYRRYYDLALLKSLGFSSASLRRELFLEFGSLFFFAMSVGFFMGWVGALVIGREVFKIDLSIDWFRIFIPGLFLSVLCLGTILLSSSPALRALPRELLSDA